MHFQRWDAPNSVYVHLFDDYAAPYETTVNCASLNYEWNETDAYAVDARNNTSSTKWVWLFRDLPAPDLRPFRMPGYDAPVVPSSITGTSTTGTLYTDQPTYFDWYWVNGGDATASGSFYVELWIDDTLYIRYPYADRPANAIGGFDDWSITIDTPGWHTVKLITDPDGAIGESDEDNNIWQGDFYWTPYGDAYEPDDVYGDASYLSGTQEHSIAPADDVDWLSFVLTEPSEVVLETSGLTGSDTRMWLYDASLNQLEYSDDEGSASYSYIDRRCGTDALPAGIYYVKVDEFGNNAEIPPILCRSARRHAPHWTARRRQ